MRLLHQRIGILSASFAAFSLMWNVFTPSNPDHVLNVIEHSALWVVFTASIFMPIKAAQALQILSLIVIAYIPMGISDSPFWGAVVATLTLVLAYAYGGFKTQAAWKLPAITVGMFTLCAIASSNFTPPSIEMYGRAAVWTLAIAFFVGILWLIVIEIRRQFFEEFAAKLILQNRELLDINKKLIEGGCIDGTRK